MKGYSYRRFPCGWPVFGPKRLIEDDQIRREAMAIWKIASRPFGVTRGRRLDLWVHPGPTTASGGPGDSGQAIVILGLGIGKESIEQICTDSKGRKIFVLKEPLPTMERDPHPGENTLQERIREDFYVHVRHRLRHEIAHVLKEFLAPSRTIRETEDTIYEVRQTVRAAGVDSLLEPRKLEDYFRPVDWALPPGKLEYFAEHGRLWQWLLRWVVQTTKHVGRE